MTGVDYSAEHTSCSNTERSAYELSSRSHQDDRTAELMKQYKKLEDDYVKQKLLNNELKRQLDDAQADHESEHESNSSKDGKP